MEEKFIEFLKEQDLYSGFLKGLDHVGFSFESFCNSSPIESYISNSPYMYTCVDVERWAEADEKWRELVKNV